MKKLKIPLPPFFQFSESRMKTDDNPAGMEKMPVLFIGHGSPMNMVLKNRFTRSLADLGASLPRPAAIMVISAHWLTRGSFVTCIDRPRMIYDFYGFPEELYRVKYGCTGAPLLAKYVTDLWSGAVRCDNAWGIDHASYSVLRHMFPSADIPVFEMSLDYTVNDWPPKTVQYHYELAKKLSALRDRGVLVIGSGNMAQPRPHRLCRHGRSASCMGEGGGRVDARPDCCRGAPRAFRISVRRRRVGLPGGTYPRSLSPDDLCPRVAGKRGEHPVYLRRVPERINLYEKFPDRLKEGNTGSSRIQVPGNSSVSAGSSP